MRPARAGDAQLDEPDGGDAEDEAVFSSSLSDSSLQSAVAAVLSGGELSAAATARTVREAAERRLGLPVDALLPRKPAILAAIKRWMEAQAASQQPQQQPQPASSFSSAFTSSQPSQQQSLVTLKRALPSSQSSASPGIAGRVKRSKQEEQQQQNGEQDEEKQEGWAAKAEPVMVQPPLSTLSLPASSNSSASFASAARRGAAPPQPGSSSAAASASFTGDGDGGGEDGDSMVGESHIVGKVADLGHNKLITVSPFQSRVLVHVRE
jgi:hypothetical protein